MRDRITIQRRTADTVGSRGQATVAFTDLETRWAEFSFLSGRELENARKVYAETTASVRIRKPYQYELTTKHQLKFRGDTFGIGAIIPVAPRFEELTLLLAGVK
jgi:SPP1 family predicted phage head-tail adaptor